MLSNCCVHLGHLGLNSALVVLSSGRYRRDVFIGWVEPLCCSHCEIQGSYFDSFENLSVCFGALFDLRICRVIVFWSNEYCNGSLQILQHGAPQFIGVINNRFRAFSTRLVSASDLSESHV